ncbi:MAG: hypothetical protein JWL81_1081, partial [Verrucomicrobiales bacterium]|nr:hypothetical protein [Verrucomicrobiales bacterium]
MFRLHRCPPPNDPARALRPRIPCRHMTGEDIPAPSVRNSRGSTFSRKILLRLLPAWALFTLTTAHGQEVQATDPTSQIKVDAVEQANGQDASLESSGQENSLEVGPITGEDAAMDGLASAELALDSQDELRSVIPQAFLFKIAAGATYNSNIFQSEFDEESDMILQYGLGVGLQSTKGGNTAFAFNYEAGAFNYLDHSDLNGINHSVGLNAGLSLPKTTLGISAAYQHIETGDQLPRQAGSASGSGLSDGDASDSARRQVSQANREVGLFNTRDVLAAALKASRNIGPKTN